MSSVNVWAKQIVEWSHDDDLRITSVQLRVRGPESSAPIKTKVIKEPIDLDTAREFAVEFEDRAREEAEEMGAGPNGKSFYLSARDRNDRGIDKSKGWKFYGQADDDALEAGGFAASAKGLLGQNMNMTQNVVKFAFSAMGEVLRHTLEENRVLRQQRMTEDTRALELVLEKEKLISQSHERQMDLEDRQMRRQLMLQGFEEVKPLLAPLAKGMIDYGGMKLLGAAGVEMSPAELAEKAAAMKKATSANASERPRLRAVPSQPPMTDSAPSKPALPATEAAQAAMDVADDAGRKFAAELPDEIFDALEELLTVKQKRNLARGQWVHLYSSLDETQQNKIGVTIGPKLNADQRELFGDFYGKLQTAFKKMAALGA